jgi:hypothetical protein
MSQTVTHHAVTDICHLKKKKGEHVFPKLHIFNRLAALQWKANGPAARNKAPIVLL